MNKGSACAEDDYCFSTHHIIIQLCRWNKLKLIYLKYEKLKNPVYELFPRDCEIILSLLRDTF